MIRDINADNIVVGVEAERYAVSILVGGRTYRMEPEQVSVLVKKLTSSRWASKNRRRQAEREAEQAKKAGSDEVKPTELNRLLREQGLMLHVKTDPECRQGLNFAVVIRDPKIPGADGVVWSCKDADLVHATGQAIKFLQSRQKSRAPIFSGTLTVPNPAKFEMEITPAKASPINLVELPESVIHAALIKALSAAPYPVVVMGVGLTPRLAYTTNSRELYMAFQLGTGEHTHNAVIMHPFQGKFTQAKLDEILEFLPDALATEANRLNICKSFHQ